MSNLKITYGSGIRADDVRLSEISVQVLEYICNQVSGISSILVTSVCRTPQQQGTVMFQNLQTPGDSATYGKYGKAVEQIYTDFKNANGLSIKEPITGIDADTVKNDMIAKILSYGSPAWVSNHCGDPTKLQVFDVAVSSINGKEQQFAIQCAKALTDPKLLKHVIGPNTFATILGCDHIHDKAFHLEIWQDHRAPKVPDISTSVKAPSKSYNMSKNTILYKPENWLQALSKDFTDSASVSPYKI